MRYLIALGSNQYHGRYGHPKHVIDAALQAIDAEIITRSKIISTPPLGPSQRYYANAAAVIESEREPPELLTHLHSIEQNFGRRRCRRWGARVIDLDIILWSEGIWASPKLSIPHPAYAQRSFVLGPATQIAPSWRDPINTLTLKHLKARLDRKRALA